MRTGDFSDTAYLQSLNGTTAYYATVTPCSPYGSNTSLCQGTTGLINPAAIDQNGKALINALPLPNANPATNNGVQPAFEHHDLPAARSGEPEARLQRQPEESLLGPLQSRVGVCTVSFRLLRHLHAKRVSRRSVQQEDTSQSIVGNLSTVINSTLTNQLIASFTQLSFKTYLGDETAISRKALGYTAADLYNNNTDILPNIQPAYGGGGYASIYLEGGSYPTTNAPQQTYVVNESVTKIYRTHTFKAGFYFAQQQFGQLTPGQQNGDIETGGNMAALTTPATRSPTLLTGQIAGYSQSTANFVGHMTEKRADFFVQDQWKFTPRFTFNYGLRVNHIGAWYEDSGKIVVFDPALYNSADTYAQAPGLVTHATNPSISISGGHPLGFQLAPDIGFAWDALGNGTTIVRGGFGTNYYADPGSNAFSTIEAPPNETFTSFYGLTTISAIPTLQTYLPLGLYGIGDIHDSHLPVTRSYTLAVAQTYAHGFNTELSYNGNVSKYLTGYIDTNPVPEGCPGEYPGYAPGSYNDTTCRPYSLLSGLSTEEHNLSSFFNSLQATASKKTGVVNFWLTYTYGKALGYNCENPFDERRCYGVTPFDRSQNLNISYLINLPNVSAKYLGNHAFGNALLDGWQFTGIEQFGTGNPLEFTGAASANGNDGNEYDGLHNRTINFYAVSNGAPAYYTPNFDNRVTVGTPDEQGVPTLACDPRSGLHAHQYFNAACFISPQLGAPNKPSIGQYELPYIHGPRYEADDIGLYKAFKMADQRSVQFRAQAFNIFNHPLDSFIQYDPGLYLTYDAYGAAPTNPNQAGYASTKLGSRTVQLEAKIYF